MRLFFVVLALFSFTAAWAAEVANLSGNWWLNTKRSRWADHKQPPNNVAIQVEHQEPKLKYSGTVNLTGEDAPVKFDFDGAIDGKEYSSMDGGQTRKIAFSRKSDRVVQSVSTLPDGRTKEVSTLTLSGDGKTLERKIEVQEGSRTVRSWTEIYEKRQ